MNRPQSTEHERACVNRVWAFVTVDIGERGERKPVVRGPERQARVKEQLRKKFAEEAFSENAFEADEVLNEFLTRDVLAWGDQLLAEDAANKAMAAANAATSAEGVQGDPRAEADVQKPEGGEAADAAARSARYGTLPSLGRHGEAIQNFLDSLDFLDF